MASYRVEGRIGELLTGRDSVSRSKARNAEGVGLVEWLGWRRTRCG
jgi:hypothetical protein